MNPPVLTTSTPVSLRRLFPRGEFRGAEDLMVTQATSDSRKVTPGCLFAACPGVQTDGHSFIPDALSRGASQLLVSQAVADWTGPQCVVPNVREAYARLCQALAGNPSHRLRTVGVTGTNGKTTTTWTVRACLQAAGFQTGMLGTIEYFDGLRGDNSTLTTPSSETLASWLGRMVELRTTHVAMELSSHALDQDRNAGVELDVAVLTNITQDHFDYHRTIEEYTTAKRRIFENLKPGGIAAINLDDPVTTKVATSLKSSPLVTFGISPQAQIRAEIIEESLAGTSFVLRIPGQRDVVCTLPLIGRHNVSNALAAATACWHLGLSSETIATGLGQLKRVPGRMERVDAGQPFHVFVDYAHTDDALHRCIRTVRAGTSGRVICVYGAGGNRDRGKRPLLTRAALEADVAFLTSDNPRTEDPRQIFADCLSECANQTRQPILLAERRQAIAAALEEAHPGDCVLIAGKGHETEQIIGTQKLFFDDRTEAHRLLRERQHKDEGGRMKDEIDSLVLGQFKKYG